MENIKQIAEIRIVEAFVCPRNTTDTCKTSMLDLYSMGGKLVIGVVEDYSKGRIDSHSKYDANRQGPSL